MMPIVGNRTLGWVKTLGAKDKFVGFLTSGDEGATVATEVARGKTTAATCFVGSPVPVRGTFWVGIGVDVGVGVDVANGSGRGMITQP
jgi:hypothetical protein